MHPIDPFNSKCQTVRHWRKVTGETIESPLLQWNDLNVSTYRARHTKTDKKKTAQQPNNRQCALWMRMSPTRAINHEQRTKRNCPTVLDKMCRHHILSSVSLWLWLEQEFHFICLKYCNTMDWYCIRRRRLSKGIFNVDNALLSMRFGKQLNEATMWKLKVHIILVFCVHPLCRFIWFPIILNAKCTHAESKDTRNPSICGRVFFFVVLFCSCKAR